MSATTASSDRHRIDRMAPALRRIADAADVALPIAHARSVAATVENDTELDVLRLGGGIVIRTVSATKDRLPVVVGYADSRGRWYRDGSRHVETPTAEGPVEAMEIGL
jgi:hypothetical protein